MTRKPTIVVCLFDQKSSNTWQKNNAKLAAMKRVSYTASDIVRYCTRLHLLPGPYTLPIDIPAYITRSGEVGAVAFRNFDTNDLAGMSRELERDALMASSALSRPWIHGCISIAIDPAEFDRKPDDLLDMGHSLMKMFGVDENRYMLAVHLDSDHIHVHFLYARVDGEGQLRERDRKMPKFMAEEATALLARQFDFALEPHHLSRVTSQGVLDLASDRIIRDLDFGEIYDGMKSRNSARKKTKGNELLTLALVARHEARDLLEFRTLLASHGITYEKSGSGAEFVDINGRSMKASDIDHKRRFTPTNMFGGVLLTDFPKSPKGLLQEAERVRADAKLTQDIGSYSILADDHNADAKLASPTRDHAKLVLHDDADAKMASASSAEPIAKSDRKGSARYNEEKEIERLLSDRDTNDAPSDQEARWDKAAVAALKSRPGRPAKPPIAPGWRAQTKFDGFLGSPIGHRAGINFSDRYATLEQPWQTEVWRDGQLVASIRYSRMAIISNNDDDLREALCAAQRAWGTVEIIGKPKFKKKMARLAADLDIPISNPELQDGIARIKKAKRPAIVPAVISQSSVSGKPVPTADSEVASFKSTEPEAQQVTARYVVPSPLRNPAVHAEPPALQKREAARQLLVVPPLSRLSEAVVAAAPGEEAVAQPDARVDVGLKQTNVLVSTDGSRCRSGNDERLDGSGVSHRDASLTPGQSASSLGVRLPQSNLDKLELDLKLSAGARPPIDGTEVSATSVRQPDRAEVADRELTTPGAVPSLSQNPVGYAETSAMQADEAVFRPLVVPPLAAQAQATLASALVEKDGTSKPNIPASTEKHADRAGVPQEQAFEAAQTEKPLGEAPPPQSCDAIAEPTYEGMPKFSGAVLPPKSYYRELAGRLAQGPDPEANRALEPRARTNDQSSVKERVVEQPFTKALADAASWGGLAVDRSVNSTNSSHQPGALNRSAIDDLHRHEPNPEEPTAMAETKGEQGPELQTDPEIVPSARTDDATGRALAKQLMDAWDELNLNDMETRDEICRDKRSLVLSDGKVAFAKPEAAPVSHCRFLAAFPNAARRLFAEEQSRLKSEEEKKAFLQRGTGVA